MTIARYCISDLFVFDLLIQFNQYSFSVFILSHGLITVSKLQIVISFAELFMILSIICLKDFAYDLIHSL